MGIFKALRKEDKDSLGLLRQGTFLETFDLMLYIHMAVVLNDIFFPPSNHPWTPYLSAALFSSTFILRPLGALIFGWLGDNYGRKATVSITMFLMAFTCFIVANLATYAEIGLTATWLIVACRMVQGISSLGEVVGAELYLMETIKHPYRYPAVAMISVSSISGGLVALMVAAVLMSFDNFSWRIPFWFGCAVGFFGSFARIKLRETPEFLEAKYNKDQKIHKKSTPKSEFLKNIGQSRKTAVIFFLIQCANPVGFYFAYIYCAGILKEVFHYTPKEIIYQSLIIGVIHFFTFLWTSQLSGRIYPLKILKIKAMICSIFVCIFPFMLTMIAPIQNDFSHSLPYGGLILLIIQATGLALSLDTAPAVPIFFSYFPVLKRFTYGSLTHAFSRAVMYTITSFGLIYLTQWFGHFGLWVLFIPTVTAFILGLLHFENLEKQFGDYPSDEDHETGPLNPSLKVA